MTVTELIGRNPIVSDFVWLAVGFCLVHMVVTADMAAGWEFIAAVCAAIILALSKVIIERSREVISEVSA